MARPGPISAISGITADADTEAAQAFVEYSMSDGYTATLAIAPEGKFPVRRGDGENPTAFTRGLGAARRGRRPPRAAG
jgi:ABC-type Fe3+ transport system substrate-binding protein